MDKININYKITFYDLNCVIDNLTACYPSDTLFPEIIDDIVKKNNISYFQLYVENLKTNTWEKILGEQLALYCAGDNYHYQWCNYKISDIEATFKLFDQTINIIINGPWICGLLGKEEGIKFFIKNNEKDRHEFEPHVHCKYSGEEMRIRIDTLQIMKNDKEFKNKRKTKAALEWVKNNQKALLNYYNSFAIKGNNIPFEINI